MLPNLFPVENKIFLAKNNGKMPWDETKCVIMKDCFQNLATNTQKRSGSSVGSGSFSGSGSLTKRSGSHLVDPKRAKRSGSRIPGVRVVPALNATCLASFDVDPRFRFQFALPPLYPACRWYVALCRRPSFLVMSRVGCFCPARRCQPS